MKKLTLTLVMFALITFSAKAQLVDTIPNGGFEKWTTIGFSKYPENYGSLDVLYIFMGATELTIQQSSDANTGKFAAKVKPVTVTDSSGKQQLPAIIFNQSAYSKRPASLIGYAKGTFTAADSVIFGCGFTNANGDTLGGGFYRLTAAPSSYTKFSIPITWTKAGAPDSASVVIAYVGAGDNGHYMLVDDLAFEGGNVGIGETNEHFNLSVYPNPANGNSNLSFITKNPGAYKLEMFDATGKATLIHSDKISEIGVQNFNFNADNYSPGVYTFKLTTKGSVATKKFVLTR